MKIQKNLTIKKKKKNSKNINYLFLTNYYLDHIIQKNKVNNSLIDYKKRYYKNNTNILWPVNLAYGGKSYYPSNKLDSLTNINTNIIHYYCNNHNLNTEDKKKYFKKHKCNGKIDYFRKKNEFFLVHEHNEKCDLRILKIYDNELEIENSMH